MNNLKQNSNQNSCTRINHTNSSQKTNTKTNYKNFANLFYLILLSFLKVLLLYLKVFFKNTVRNALAFQAA